MAEKTELCRIWAKVLPTGNAIVVVQLSDGSDPSFYEASAPDQIESMTRRLIEQIAQTIPTGVEAVPNADNTEMIVYSVW